MARVEPSELDDPRLLRISQEYLADVEAGRRLGKEHYLSRYPELRAPLVELLDGIDLAESLQPATMQADVPTAEPLGDFRILREIGRGGMGVVYEAIQLSLGRKVALKVLPFASAIDARQRQRFQLESRAAALMHHPNIVPVYAVGCERGLHFYAMQLIEGGSLAELIVQRRANKPASDALQPTLDTARCGPASTRSFPAHSQGRVPSRRSTVRQMVELAARVADALEYAHQSGIIHRDIKPANLLLDHAGNVWVTDFGLAHVVSDASLTMTGDVLGTMRYMSPEQAGGQRAVVDGRSDLYSLGATLYELLTLRPVFDSNDRAKLLGQILRDDPIPPRQHDRSLPIELETIVLKCLAKNPADRYATAADLANDLRRFLEERPILARRPTLTDTVRKYFRRHPSLVAAGLIVWFALGTGLIITTAVVKQSADRERQRALEAEARFDLARSAADELIHVAQNELSHRPFQDGAKRRLLETALKYYQELIIARQEQPEEQAALEETRDRVAQILNDLRVLQIGRDNTLLLEPDVLADLQASDEQRRRITALTEGVQATLATYVASNQTSDPAANFIDVTTKANIAFSSILTPEQRVRLQQIAVQWEGPRAFFDSGIIERLKLTQSQVDEIRLTLQRSLLRIVLYDSVRTDGPKFRPPSSDSLKRTVAGILPLLNAEQREAWQSLVGRPYEGEIGKPPGMPDHGPPALFIEQTVDTDRQTPHRDESARPEPEFPAPDPDLRDR